MNMGLKLKKKRQHKGYQTQDTISLNTNDLREWVLLDMVVDQNRRVINQKVSDAKTK